MSSKAAILSNVRLHSSDLYSRKDCTSQLSLRREIFYLQLLDDDAVNKLTEWVDRSTVRPALEDDSSRVSIFDRMCGKSAFSLVGILFACCWLAASVAVRLLRSEVRALQAKLWTAGLWMVGGRVLYTEFLSIRSLFSFQVRHFNHVDSPNTHL